MPSRQATSDSAADIDLRDDRIASRSLLPLRRVVATKSLRGLFPCQGIVPSQLQSRSTEATPRLHYHWHKAADTGRLLDYRRRRQHGWPWRGPRHDPHQNAVRFADKLLLRPGASLSIGRHPGRRSRTPRALDEPGQFHGICSIEQNEITRSLISSIAPASILVTLRHARSCRPPRRWWVRSCLATNSGRGNTRGRA